MSQARGTLLEIARDLGLVYAFTYLTGIGLYRLVVPPYLRRAYLHPLLAPGVGFLQLAIVVGYVIYASRPIGTAIPISAGIAIVTTVAGLRSMAFRRFRWSPRIALGTCGLAVAACAILWPVLSAGSATTPYRIGIDQVGYAESAQFLVEGGTLRGAKAALLAELDTDDLRKAKAQSYKDTHFETYVDTEFLVKAFRWGYPGSLAALTVLTGNAHVYKLEFLILIFNFALMLAVTFYLARTAFSLPILAAYAVMLAVGFNCNLLNIYYEGQLAQIFVFPYFMLLFAIFVRARTWRGGLRVLRSGETVRSIAFFALLTAGLFSAFNEVLVLIVAIIIATIAFDLVFFQRSSIVAIAIVGAGLGAGFILVFPFSQQWISYTLANLSGLSRAGFWQPHWASLAEIVGLLDMYQAPGYTLQAQTIENVRVNIGISVVAAFLVVRLLLRERDIDRSFWLAAPLLVSAEYVKSRYADSILNYPFMKVYTMFVPLLALIVLVALYRFSRDRNIAFGLGHYAASVVIVATGIFYISHYTQQRQVVTADMFALYRHDDARRFDRYALLTNHQDIRQYMFAPLISMHWIDESGVQKYFRADFDRPLATVIRQEEMSCRQCLVSFFAGSIVYEDATMVIIDTGLRVSDFCGSEVARESISALDYDPQATWHKDVFDFNGSYVTSYRQCDFRYVKKLIARSLGTT